MPGPSVVYLIRHGESEFNRRWAATGRDPLIRDAPLSALGHAQIEATIPLAQALRPDVVLTSPLSRAVQTALGLFGVTAPILVDPVHAERISNTDDVGSSPRELASRFPDLDFSSLDDPWWPVGPLDDLGVPVESDESFLARVDRFIRALQKRPEERVVVVGHGGFFGALCGRRLDNCEVARLDLGNLANLARIPDPVTRLLPE